MTVQPEKVSHPTTKGSRYSLSCCGIREISFLIKANNITTNERQDCLLQYNAVSYFGKGKIIGIPLLNVVYPFSLKRKKHVRIVVWCVGKYRLYKNDIK